MRDVDLKKGGLTYVFARSYATEHGDIMGAGYLLKECNDCWFGAYEPGSDKQLMRLYDQNVAVLLADHVIKPYSPVVPSSRITGVCLYSDGETECTVKHPDGNTTKITLTALGMEGKSIEERFALIMERGNHYIGCVDTLFK